MPKKDKRRQKEELHHAAKDSGQGHIPYNRAQKEKESISD